MTGIGSARRPAARAVVRTVAAATTVMAIAGCAKLDSSLGQQYIVVQFVPNTTLATARHVTAACSRIPNLRLEPVKPTSAQAGIVDSATFNSTTATDANLAQLQMCLQRFRSVQGLTPMQPGGS